jgi:hypothetical protein
MRNAKNSTQEGSIDELLIIDDDVSREFYFI